MTAPFQLAWAVTGAGDLLPETVDAMARLSQTGQVVLTTILSRAADFVINTYRLRDRIEAISHSVKVEKNANSPFIAGPLQTGKYDLLLVAPATGNTVAKIVHGICDSLVSNAVAMANKTPMPVVILPVEQRAGAIETRLPDGRPLTLFTRQVDAENTAMLGRMPGIRVITHPREISPGLTMGMPPHPQTKGRRFHEQS